METMTDATTTARLDKLIIKCHIDAKIAIKSDRRRFEERASDREERLREAVLEYEQYLLTLDPSTLSAILDLSDCGSVFVTNPVDIDNERLNRVGLYYRGSNELLCGPPETGNTDPLLRVPDGKYRFVLIAVPVEDDV